MEHPAAVAVRREYEGRLSVMTLKMRQLEEALKVGAMSKQQQPQQQQQQQQPPGTPNQQQQQQAQQQAQQIRQLEDKLREAQASNVQLVRKVDQARAENARLAQLLEQQQRDMTMLRQDSVRRSATDKQQLEELTRQLEEARLSSNSGGGGGGGGNQRAATSSTESQQTIEQLRGENKVLNAQIEQLKTQLKRKSHSSALFNKDHVREALAEYSKPITVANPPQPASSTATAVPQLTNVASERMASSRSQSGSSFSSQSYVSGSHTASPRQPLESSTAGNTELVIIKKEKLDEFKETIDDLLVSAHSEDPTDILAYTKGVIKACRSISEDLDTLPGLSSIPEKIPEGAPPPTNPTAVAEDAYRRAKQHMKTTLAELVEAVKQHASGMGMAPVSLVEAAASRLTASFVDLVRSARVIVRLAARTSTDSSNMAPVAPLRSSSLRGDGAYSPVPATASVSARTTAQRALSESSFASTGSNSHPGLMHSPTTTSSNSRFDIASASQRQTPQPQPQHQQQQQQQQQQQPSRGTLQVLTFEQLRDYLDSGTEQIASRIQATLRDSRGDNLNGVQIFETLADFHVAVANVIQACRPTFELLDRIPALTPAPIPAADAHNVLTAMQTSHSNLVSIINELRQLAQIGGSVPSEHALHAAVSLHTAPSLDGTAAGRYVGFVSTNNPSAGNDGLSRNDIALLSTERVREKINEKAFKQRIASGSLEVARATKLLCSLMDD